MYVKIIEVDKGGDDEVDEHVFDMPGWNLDGGPMDEKSRPFQNTPKGTCYA